MKTNIQKYVLLAALTLIVLVPGLPSELLAQYFPGMAVPSNPSAQRSALQSVRSQVDWLQNSTRTSSGYVTGGYEMVWGQFQALRSAYSALTMTLNPQQQAQGANDLAELSAGLDILQEAFSNYQNDVASGRQPSAAMSDMCQVLRQASGVWLQQCNKVCSRLRVGF